MSHPGDSYSGVDASYGSWNSSRRFEESYAQRAFASGTASHQPPSLSYTRSPFHSPSLAISPQTTSGPYFAGSTATSFAADMRNPLAPPGAVHGSRNAFPPWDPQGGKTSPSGSIEDVNTPPLRTQHSPENVWDTTNHQVASLPTGTPRAQRKPSNRDEFDGPHQFLPRPPPDVMAFQERELPHLPTNLHVQEQDSVLSQVNDRLSQCAFDFVAKYQFPIPLSQDMRPVERPQDREWTEWVYLLKRLATKRRIPARVLYNGQIKQFVTILENSLEMRHAAKHQSRPLKDDRNILQLISAGIQVAKILKDASAMDYLDRLYISTERQIQDRSAGRYRP